MTVRMLMRHVRKYEKRHMRPAWTGVTADLARQRVGHLREHGPAEAACKADHQIAADPRIWSLDRPHEQVGEGPWDRFSWLSTAGLLLARNGNVGPGACHLPWPPTLGISVPKCVGVTGIWN